MESWISIHLSGRVALTAAVEGVDAGRGGAGHIHARVADESLVVTAAIDIVEAAREQIDSRAAGTQAGSRTQAGEGAAAEDIHLLEAVFLLRLRVIDEDIALLMHGIVQSVVTGVALAGAEDDAHMVAGVVGRHEMHEGVVIHVRVAEEGVALAVGQRAAVSVGVVLVDAVGVVIAAIAAAEEAIDAALDILHIGRGPHQVQVEGHAAGLRGMVLRAFDDAAEVIATIYIIAHPREAALIADMHFRSAEDVGVAGAAEGIIDAAVAEIDV